MPIKHTPRSAEEQKFWDDLAIAIAIDCWRKQRSPEGCAHKVKDFCDEMLIQRRLSARGK